MKNPFGDQQVPGSYFDLQKRLLKKVQDTNVKDRIQNILQMTYEEALTSESVVLSRPERQRLFHQISKTMLQELLNQLDAPTSGTKPA